MKITNELNQKMQRVVDEKYSPLISNLQEEMNTIRDDAREGLRKFLEDNQHNPFINTLIKNNRRSSYDQSIEAMVNNVYDDYLPISEYGKLRIEVIQSKIRELRAKKSSELEDFRIAISYGKTLDDIKTAFDNLGYKF